MKYLIGIVIIFFTSSTVIGATPDEEARVIKAVKQAFATKDPKHLHDIYCWDGVPEWIKNMTKEQDQAMVRQQPASVEIVPADKDVISEFTYEGKNYVSNLKIKKQLKITMVPKKREEAVVKVPLGEKNGRLYFVLPRPAKWSNKEDAPGQKTAR